MEQIIASTKVENGIVVFWLEGNDRKWELFNYQELIDLKISMINLLERPTSYQIDPTIHRLAVKKQV